MRDARANAKGKREIAKLMEMCKKIESMSSLQIAVAFQYANSRFFIYGAFVGSTLTAIVIASYSLLFR